MKNRYLVALSIQSLLWGTTPLIADDANSSKSPTTPQLVNVSLEGGSQEFKINFQNIPILEFMKFVSKIGNINFIYDPADLNFAITVVSDQPSTLENVLGAFTQVLKINGLSLIEDGNSYLINRNPNIKQIPAIVSDEMPFSGKNFPAYVTRVFRLENVDPGKVATLIKPMISGTALVDIFPTSRLLIVTDITSNINQISKLISILDQPKANLQFSNYAVRSGNISALKMLAEQLIPPLIGDAPFILVPQPSSNILYIVSTPYAANLATSILSEIESASMNEGGRTLSGSNIYIYPLKYRSAEFIENSLKNIGANAASLGFSSQGLYETIANEKYLKTTNSLLFIGPEDSIERIKQLLLQIDIPGKPANMNEHAHFFMFHPTYISPSEVKSHLTDIATSMDESGLSDQALIATIQNARIVDGTHSILFTGDSASIQEVKTLAEQIDKQNAQPGASSSYYIYKMKHGNIASIQASLTSLVENLSNSKMPDQPLIQAIQSMRYIQETNSIIFTGNDKSIAQLHTIVPTFDTDTPVSSGTGDFIMYTPKFVMPEHLLQTIQDVEQRLSQSSTADPALIQSLQSAKYIPASHAIMFTGSPAALERVKTLLGTLDQGKQFIRTEDQVYIYSPKYVSESTIRDSLENFSSTLSDSDPTKQTIQTGKWIDTSRSFVFQGPPASIQKIQQLLAVTDVSGPAKPDKTYFVYKLKYISGDVVLKDLKQMVRNLQVSSQEQDELSSVVDNIEWIKSTNSLFISGPTYDVNQIKSLISEFDAPSDDKNQKPLDLNSNFLVYKPLHMSAKDIEDNLRGLATDLEESGLSDTSLINTINSVKISGQTGSLVFTGTQSNLDRIKSLIATIDVENPNAHVQQVGMSTFLIYKIKNSNYDYLLSNLRSLANDLDAAKGGDKDLVKSIEGMRFIKDTNSIVFTGSPQTLEKIKTIVEKFDVTTGEPAPVRTPGGYILYKPKYVPGPDLINILRDFEQNLQSTGIDQQDLYEVINHLKWMDKTGNILVSGNDTQVQAVKDLLERFDVPQKGQSKPANIETYDDMTFLTYKLQYHQGDEIQVALKQVAQDLQKIKDSSENQKLVNAIQSIQWIKVTNSLITSGDARTLEKLREFLTSIDRPLTQVYIEVLVLQTTLGKRLDFGLQWASQGKYKDRFGYGFGNFPATPVDNGTFAKNLSGITATNTPTGGDIPFITGGELGIIGDIILHKGKSYFALGALVNAIQQDGDTTVVINQKIVAQDNNNAQLFVGSNIPFSGSTVQIIGQTQTTSSNLEYRDVGTSLNITPYIGDNNIITLDIDFEISSNNQSNQASSSSSSSVPSNQVSALITEKTTIQTRLQIPDQHFVALSGMIQDTTAHDRTGIPCLGGLPVVGALFSENQTTTEKNNVIMFLKPTIIKTNDIFKEITERQEELFRSQAEKESYDKGINLVSTPDDA